MLISSICMTITGLPLQQHRQTRPIGMFDVDCSNIGIRCSPITKLLTNDTDVASKTIAVAKSKGHDSANHGARSMKSSECPQKKIETPTSLPLPCQHNRRNHPSITASGSDVRVLSHTPLVIQRKTLASMYIASMFIGFAVLGIVGGATSQQHVFLSFSLFYGVFIPVVILHGTTVIHRVSAAIPMLIYLIYAPVSVSLSIIHKSHVFLSISLVMVGFCFLVAGVGGWLRVGSAIVLALFASMCFGGALHSPDRGDVIALVVVPTIQIIYVCLAGAFSVIMIPASVTEENNNNATALLHHKINLIL
jgi:hypothetical protein